MSYRHEQAARHTLLSAYAAEGNHEAKDRMIASIERAATEQQESYRVIAAIVGIAAFVTIVLKIISYAIGF